MKTFKLLVLLSVLNTLVSCLSHSKNISEDKIAVKNDIANKSLFENNCHACHSIKVYNFGPPLGNYTDTVGGLLAAYNSCAKYHRDIHLGKTEINKIENYILHRRDYINQ